jgi:hypothetical protein
MSTKKMSQEQIAQRLKKKYKLSDSFEGNVTKLLNDHQNILATLLLVHTHPLAEAVRKAAINEERKKKKRKQEALNRKRANAHNNLVPVMVQGGGKATMWTMGSRSAHRGN